MELTTINKTFRLLILGLVIILGLVVVGCSGDEATTSKKPIRTEVPKLDKEPLPPTSQPTVDGANSSKAEETTPVSEETTPNTLSKEKGNLARAEKGIVQYTEIVKKIQLNCGMVDTNIIVGVVTGMEEGGGRIAQFIPREKSKGGSINISYNFLRKLFTQVEDTKLQDAIIAIILGHEFVHALQNVQQNYAGGKGNSVSEALEHEADIYGLMTVYQAGYPVLEDGLYEKALRTIYALDSLNGKLPGYKDLDQRVNNAPLVIKKLRGLVYLYRTAVYLTATGNYKTADELYKSLNEIYRRKNWTAVGYHGGEVYFNRGMNAYLQASEELGLQGFPVSLARESELTRLGPILGRKTSLSGPKDYLMKSLEYFDDAVGKKPLLKEYRLQRLIANLSLQMSEKAINEDLEFLQTKHQEVASDHAELANLSIAISDFTRTPNPDTAVFRAKLNTFIRDNPEYPRVKTFAGSYLDDLNGKRTGIKLLQNEALPKTDQPLSLDAYDQLQTYRDGAYKTYWREAPEVTPERLLAARIEYKGKVISIHSKPISLSPDVLLGKSAITVEDGLLYPVAGEQRLVFRQHQGKNNGVAYFLIEISTSDAP